MMVNTVIPIPIERLISANALAASVGDKMLAAGGVALLNPTHAARCYPSLWSTPDAARMAFNRSEPQAYLVAVSAIGGRQKARFRLVRSGSGARPGRMAD
jgi:hypothetical protein